MKLRRKELLTAVELVSCGLAKKEEIEQSLSLVFKDGRVQTYNENIAASTPADIGVEGAVKAEEFISFLRKLKTKRVFLSAEDKKITVKGGKAEGVFPFSTKIKLALDQVPKPGDFEELPEEFTEASIGCLVSVSDDYLKPALSCLYVHKNSVLSCDNYRLTERRMKKKVPKSFLFPADAARKLLPLGLSKYSVTDKWIHFTCGKTIYSCRTCGLEYPAVRGLLDVQGQKIKFPDKMKDILGRAAIFTKREPWNARVKIEIKDNLMTVSSKSEVGTFHETCEIKREGPPCSFSTSPIFLMEILPFLKTATIGDKAIGLFAESFTHVIALLV